MPFRFRKSIKVMPGVRMTVSKSGIGTSVGGGGVRYSVHSSGRRTASVGIPGTGLGYTKTLSSKSGRKTTSRAAPVPQPAAQQPVKPGWFAPRGEKQLYKAITNNDSRAIGEVGRNFKEYRPVSYGLSGLMLARDEKPEEARQILAVVMEEGGNPADHPFAQKYLGGSGGRLAIAPGIVAEIPFGRDLVGLTLAELYQETGDIEAAIDVVEQLEPTAHAAVSLAELYIQVGRYDEVIDLTNGIKNEDDATALLCVYRGVALREQGFYEASRGAFKEALKSKSRDPEIRHLGLSERAYTYLAENKKAMARKDLERILGENASYVGVRERLEEFSS
jgi:tetratricopeptide (TPR) repeat protein